MGPVIDISVDDICVGDFSELLVTVADVLDIFAAPHRWVWSDGTEFYGDSIIWSKGEFYPDYDMVDAEGRQGDYLRWRAGPIDYFFKHYRRYIYSPYSTVYDYLGSKEMTFFSFAVSQYMIYPDWNPR